MSFFVRPYAASGLGLIVFIECPRIAQVPVGFTAPEHGLAFRLAAHRQVYVKVKPVCLYIDVFNVDSGPGSLVTGR